MQRVVFTNSRNQAIVLESSPFHLVSISGLGGLGADIQTQKAPYQDGETFIDSLLDMRYITIEMHIKALTDDELYQKRSQLQTVLNPKLGIGTLRYDYPGGSKVIDVVPDGLPEYPSGSRNSSPNFQRTFINLVGPDPALKDTDVTILTLASFIGGFEFPFQFPLELGEVGQELLTINNGNLDTPIFVTMKGPLQNPVLENLTTGKKLSIIENIPSGESLEINTTFGKKSVIRIDSNGIRTNAFHWVDPTSDFWQLIPGENIVSYAATQSAEDATVTIEYQARYVGI